MSRISKFLLLGLLFLFNCAQADDRPSSSVVDLSGLLDLQQLLPLLSDKRVVYVGETHDRYDHHLNQLTIIKHQYQQNEKLAIGLEFIQQPFQQVLDDYVAGNIDEATMLLKTDYFERWRYDFRLYRPIFSFAREHGLPLIALNIDRNITNQVKSEGIDSLSEEQRIQLPTEIYRDDEAYQKRLKEVFLLHPNATDSAFERFVEIQLLWDESMAERAANWLRNNPEGNMVILAGSGHVMYGSGIPDRLQRRIQTPASSVINLSEMASMTPDMGDFVILSTKQELKPAGKLGAILDSTESPPKITGFVPGSGAKLAGLKKNDRITAIDGEKITSYADIRIALLDKEVESVIRVEVSRKRLLGGLKARQFEVILK